METANRGATQSRSQEGAASSSSEWPSPKAGGARIQDADCGCPDQGKTDQERFDHLFSCGYYEQGLVALTEVEEEEYFRWLENPEMMELFMEFVKRKRQEPNLTTSGYKIFQKSVAEVARRILPEEEDEAANEDPPAKKSKKQMTQVTLSEYSFFHEPSQEVSEPVPRAEEEKPVVIRPLVTVHDICNSLALYFDFLNKRGEYAKFVNQVSEHIRTELGSNAAFPKPVQSDSSEGELSWEESSVPEVRQFVTEISNVEAMIAEQGCFRVEVGDFGLHVCFNSIPVLFPSSHAAHMRFTTFDVDGFHVEIFDGKAPATSKQSYASLAQRLQNLRFGQIFIMGAQWNKESIFNFKRHVQSHLNACGHVSGNFVDLAHGNKFALYGMRGSADRLGQVQCRPGGVYIYMKPNDMSSVLDGPLARRDGNCAMCKMHRGCGLRKGIRDENIYIPSNITWDYLFEVFQKVGFPHCESRKNVMTAGTTFLECFCFGIVNCYGKGPVMSTMTNKMHNMTRLINKKFHQDAPYMELKEQKHHFTVCQVNRSVKCKMHVDGNNVGPSYICAFGDYTGGETWIYDGVGPVDQVVEEHLRGHDVDVGSVIKGSLHDVKNKWVYFSGRVPHCTMPFKGKRYALVLFIHNCTGRLKDEATIKQLEDFGFCTPPIGFDYSRVVTEEDLCHYDENPDVENDSHTAADASEVDQTSDAGDSEEAVQDGEYSVASVHSSGDETADKSTVNIPGTDVASGGGKTLETADSVQAEAETAQAVESAQGEAETAQATIAVTQRDVSVTETAQEDFGANSKVSETADDVKPDLRGNENVSANVPV